MQTYELRGLQPQSPGVKLQGLHKKALYVRFNRLHDQRGRISQRGKAHS